VLGAASELAAEAGDRGEPVLVLVDEVGEQDVHLGRRDASPGAVRLDGLVGAADGVRDGLQRDGDLVGEGSELVVAHCR
jgi:hypothetical protein